MKSVFKISIFIAILALFFSGCAPRGTITKGLIGKQDIRLWDGVTSTFTRTSSTGDYTLTLNRLDWPGVDVLSVYGGGVNRTKATLTSALTAVGSTNKMRFFLSPGTWTIDDDLTITSNITLYIPPGAVLSVSATKTFTIEGPIEAGPYQIFSGSGTVTISSVIFEHDQWRDGSGVNIFPTSNSAIDLGSSTREFKDFYLTGTAYLDTITGDPIPGYLSRSKFAWKDGDEIYINPGMYQHNGTANQLVYWNSQITFELESAGSNSDSDDYGADGWHYIYLDDSAIVTQASPLLDADCFLNDTTAPTYSVTKHGWYNGSDRCIFAVYETLGAILEFFHDGGDCVVWANRISERTNSDLDLTWVDVDMATSMPAFSTKAKIQSVLYAMTTDGLVYAYWRTNGQTGTSGHEYVGFERISDTNQLINISGITVFTDTNQTIEVKLSRSDADTLSVELDAWYFPNGM